MTSQNPKQLLQDLFSAAVQATHPSQCLTDALPEPARGKTIVIGAGKAGASMAKVVEQHWTEYQQTEPARTGENSDSTAPTLEGLVVTRYQHGLTCDHIEIIEASHPVPDNVGEIAAGRLLQRVSTLNESDLVLCLMSGGGSSLLSLPMPPVTLDDKQAVTRQLLKRSATIHEINCVRKHISLIKGGRLGLACFPAKVVNLMISDVAGDDMSVIASGPTVGDATTRHDALDVIRKFDIELPESVRLLLNSESCETPAPDDPKLANIDNIIVANGWTALNAASNTAKEHGVQAVILGDDIEGEARVVGEAHARHVMELLNDGMTAPFVVLSGGETTVNVAGTGRGGRNAEYLLALTIALNGAADIYALAADTDGIDGIETNAGALTGPDTLSRAASNGADAQAFLDNNDAFSFFEQCGDLVTTGPTRTNVNDFRAVLVMPSKTG